jgi:hypothetical protein
MMRRPLFALLSFSLLMSVVVPFDIPILDTTTSSLSGSGFPIGFYQWPSKMSPTCTRGYSRFQSSNSYTGSAAGLPIASISILTNAAVNGAATCSASILLYNFNNPTTTIGARVGGGTPVNGWLNSSSSNTTTNTFEIARSAGWAIEPNAWYALWIEILSGSCRGLGGGGTGNDDFVNIALATDTTFGAGVHSQVGVPDARCPSYGFSADPTISDAVWALRISTAAAYDFLTTTAAIGAPGNVNVWLPLTLPSYVFQVMWDKSVDFTFGDLFLALAVRAGTNVTSTFQVKLRIILCAVDVNGDCISASTLNTLSVANLTGVCASCTPVPAYTRFELPPSFSVRLNGARASLRISLQSVMDQTGANSVSGYEARLFTDASGNSPVSPYGAQTLAATFSSNNGVDFNLIFPSPSGSAVSFPYFTLRGWPFAGATPTPYATTSQTPSSAVTTTPTPSQTSLITPMSGASPSVTPSSDPTQTIPNATPSILSGPNPNNNNNNNGDNNNITLSPGASAGVAVAVILVTLFLSGAIFVFFRTRRGRNTLRARSGGLKKTATPIIIRNNPAHGLTAVPIQRVAPLGSIAFEDIVA